MPRIDRNARPSKLTASDRARLAAPISTRRKLIVGRAFVFVCDHAIAIGMIAAAVIVFSNL